jgi:hypothetical protein
MALLRELLTSLGVVFATLAGCAVLLFLGAGMGALADHLRERHDRHDWPDGEAVLDGFADVPWAVRMERTYLMTRDASLSRLVIGHRVTLMLDNILRCRELVNYGAIVGEVVGITDRANEGCIDPRSMRQWQ